MRKLLACALLAATITVVGNVSLAGENYEEAGLEVVEQEVVQQEEPVLNIRDRLEYQVSRGEIRALYMKTTAYDLSVESCGKSPEHPAYGITASGTKVHEGTVAVDPDVIPLGTRLYIDGYGMAIAEDTGGAIEGNRLDIYMADKEDCLKWGVKTRKVYILGRE